MLLVTKKKKQQKIEAWIVLIVWLGAIFYLSSIPSLTIGASPLWEFILRKLAHFFEYFVLNFLIYRVLLLTEKRDIPWNIFWAFMFSILYAFSDEYHQTFVQGRSGRLLDVGIDSFGSLISAWLLYLNYRHEYFFPKLTHTEDDSRDINWKT